MRGFTEFCSPRTPDSEWVAREIEYFGELGRKDNSLGNRTVWVWNAETGKEIAEYVHDRPVPTAVFSSDNRHILTIDEFGNVGVWRFFPNTQELINYAREQVSD